MVSREYEDLLKKWNLELEAMIREWEKRWENLGIPEKQLRSTFLAVDKLGLKYGWVSNWGYFTPAELNDLLKKWTDGKLSVEEQEQIISNHFVEFYSKNSFKNLDECITSWNQNPIFYGRMSIFRDCLFALQNFTTSFNPSNLVVPVLISQIDGIIGELLKREGFVFCKNSMKWINPDKTTEGNLEKSFGSMIKNKRTRYGRYYIGNLIQMHSRYGVLVDGIFQRSIHGDDLKNPSFLSRHKILHGEDLKYGTIKNSIKLFLILEYLSEFSISNLVEPDDSALMEFRKIIF